MTHVNLTLTPDVLISQLSATRLAGIMTGPDDIKASTTPYSRGFSFAVGGHGEFLGTAVDNVTLMTSSYGLSPRGLPATRNDSLASGSNIKEQTQ